VNGRDEALDVVGLEEKKTGLFLVNDHEFDGDVWLDCRGDELQVYGYEDGQSVSVKDSQATRKVKSQVQRSEHDCLDQFTEVRSP
jgi:hypothetical protein